MRVLAKPFLVNVIHTFFCVEFCGYLLNKSKALVVLGTFLCWQHLNMYLNFKINIALVS
jgi:hypothetical protein